MLNCSYITFFCNLVTHLSSEALYLRRAFFLHFFNYRKKKWVLFFYWRRNSHTNQKKEIYKKTISIFKSIFFQFLVLHTWDKGKSNYFIVNFVYLFCIVLNSFSFLFILVLKCCIFCFFFLLIFIFLLNNLLLIGVKNNLF